MAVSQTGPSWGELVESDRVHGSLYTDPAIFQAELERIWYRTWVYVGHTSEVPEPGDYVLKAIGPQPVIMTRDKQGNVHLLLNRCTHRGNLVCDAERGNSSAFRHAGLHHLMGELLSDHACGLLHERVTPWLARLADEPEPQ